MPISRAAVVAGSVVCQVMGTERAVPASVQYRCPGIAAIEFGSIVDDTEIVLGVLDPGARSNIALDPRGRGPPGLPGGGGSGSGNDPSSTQATLPAGVAATLVTPGDFSPKPPPFSPSGATLSRCPVCALRRTTPQVVPEPAYLSADSPSAYATKRPATARRPKTAPSKTAPLSPRAVTRPVGSHCA